MPEASRHPLTGDNAKGGLRLPDVLAFMQALWAVAHGLQRTSKRMTIDLGVTGPQRLVLRVLGLSPGMSAGVLAAALHVHPSTLTGVLRRLVAQGLIDRVDDSRDRRRAVLRLTRKGQRVNAMRTGTVETAIARALEETSAHDRLAATRMLARVATQLARQVERPARARSAPRRKA